jgi:hypothetical protein
MLRMARTYEKPQPQETISKVVRSVIFGNMGI